MVETWRVIRDDDDGAKVVEVVSVRPSTQHGARPWVAWIDGGTAAGRTGLDAVARIARLCTWAVREILAPGEPTRAEAAAAEREDLARIGRLVGCDSLVGVEIHAAVEHELLERDAARDAAERAERERDDALAIIETLRAEAALLREIIEGRTTPTRESFIALGATDGTVRYHRPDGGHGWFPAIDPWWGAVVSLCREGARLWAHDADGRPCAWPTVTP